MNNANAKSQENPEQTEPAAQEAPAAAQPSGDEIKAQYEQKLSEMKDQLLRAMAETENVRKRGERDKEESAKYAMTGFARDLVGTIENLRLASLSVPAEAREGNPILKNIAEGVDMTMRELLAVLERHGIRRIDPMGQKFDHNFHQAVAQVEDPTKEPGTVTQVMQAGYTIQDRLLRPAMVAVAKAPEAPPQRVDTQA